MIPLMDTIPHREKPFVTWMIIIVNFLVFLFQTSLPPDISELFVHHFSFVPVKLTNLWREGLRLEILFFSWPLITSMFLHGSWLHLIGNMWSLWLFGDNVEDRVGHLRFLVFYLLSGIIASLTHYIFNAYSSVPTIGASGAIAGVMGAYFIMFPLARIITIIPFLWVPLFVQIPAIFFIGFWFVSQFFSGLFSLLGPAFGGGIAWWAHIGGFIFGIIAIPFFRRKFKRYRSFFDDEFYYYQYF